MKLINFVLLVLVSFSLLFNFSNYLNIEKNKSDIGTIIEIQQKTINLISSLANVKYGNN